MGGKMNKYTSGLRRIRNFGLSRRNFNKGALGAAAITGLATAGIPGIANAATDVTFLGWEGYDSGLFVDSYLEDNDINLNTTCEHNLGIIFRMAGKPF